VTAVHAPFARRVTEPPIDRPHDIQLEQALLGAILVNNDALSQVSNFLEPRHFFEPIHQKMYEIAATLMREGKAATPITLRTFLPPDLDVAGLTASQYLARLAAEATTVINASGYGRMIADLAARRSLIELSEDMIAAAQRPAPDQPVPALMAQVTTALNELATSTSIDALKRNRFEPVRLDAIQLDDGAVHLIDGLLPIGPAFGLTVGAPKSLKSFLLMRAGLCIAAGLPFAGRKTQQGAVVYVTSEGIRGAKRRLIAMRKDLGLEGKNIPFFLIPAMPDLGTGTNDLNVLIAEIEKAIAGCGYPLAMVVIDTLRRATPGKDENSSRDMGVYIQNADAIATKFQCLVMSAHHSPRGVERRGSGSNALDGAADVMWAVTRDGNTPTATATVSWMKDGEGEGTSWNFTLRNVEIGSKDKPASSCTVDLTDAQEPAPDEMPDAKPSKTQQPGKAEKPPWQRGSLPILKDALSEVLIAHGTMRKPYPDGPEVRAGDVKLVRVEFLRRYVGNGEDEASNKKKKNKAWERAIKDATQTYHLLGTLEVEGVQLVWLAKSDEQPR
jgi:hypothetical protein